MRKIIHLDMDAFYAAVEQRDDPTLRGRPVVVGGSPEGRGVVATCSYEARRFGIHSAMPAARAIRLCPEAVFVRPRFDVYKQVSREILSLFREYTDLVEPLSLDEAYLDVTETRGFNGSATRVATEIKRRVRERTGLTVSAGVSYNKFLAKQASDLDKPDGLHLIRPEEAAAFVAALPIGRFHGVGQATERRMRQLGIHHGADLLGLDLPAMQQAFGKRAAFFHAIARGIDERPVQPRRERKSIGAENTFPRDLVKTEEMLAALEGMADKAVAALHARGLVAHTLTLKVKYADFEQITRSRSDRLPYRSREQMMPVLAALLEGTEVGERPVRLLGVTLSGLAPASSVGVSEQLGLGFFQPFSR